MKKIIILLSICTLISVSAFSQMSFTGNSLKKSGFNLNTEEKTVFKDKTSDSKVFISDEENDLTKKRRRGRSRGRRGGSDDKFTIGRAGLSFPFGTTALEGPGLMAQISGEKLVSSFFAIGLSAGCIFFPSNMIGGYDSYGNLLATEKTYLKLFPVAATFKICSMDNDFKPYIGTDLGFMLGENYGTFLATPRAGFFYEIMSSYSLGLDASCNLGSNINSFTISVQGLFNL